ncbi:hypothetical protein BDQ12DRAFT_397044 [Crucibulum laeve]|uniref:Uncharacterized protein n=1 Tax=Crucibulum laeve TaxID=68775 RepID=A0A5C3M922_9AGAR|nr:hypothetical protein BDQ12DRAFT_397044 [Crucibulum laeve]
MGLRLGLRRCRDLYQWTWLGGLGWWVGPTTKCGSPSIGGPTACGQECGGGQGQAGKRGVKSRSGSAASPPTTALSKASPVTPSKDKKGKNPVTRATLASTLPSNITNSPGVNTATAANQISSRVNTTSSSAHPAVSPTTPPINSTSFSNSSTSPSTLLSIQADSIPASGLLSPALPPAPTRQTIPLPEIDVGASFDVRFNGSMEFNASARLGTGVQLQNLPPTFDDCDASFVTCANEPSFRLDGSRSTVDADRTPRKAVPLVESTIKRSTGASVSTHVSSASQLDIKHSPSNVKPEAMKMGVPKKMKTNVNPHTNTHTKSSTDASGSRMSNNNLSSMINDTDESLMDVFDPMASSTPQSANATFGEDNMSNITTSKTRIPLTKVLIPLSTAIPQIRTLSNKPPTPSNRNTIHILRRLPMSTSTACRPISRKTSFLHSRRRMGRSGASVRSRGM